MKLIFRPITQEDVQVLLTWRYEPPYDIYNMNAGIEGEAELQQAIDYFLLPMYAFHTVIDPETDEQVAFCSFGIDGQVPGGDYQVEALDIGMGVRPDLTGQGLGTLFVGAAVAFAAQTYYPTVLRVTIAVFNKRAIRVWEKNGFQREQTFKHEHTRMVFSIFTRLLHD